jgi:hypothetical protein
MPKINNYDALTNTNSEITISAAELSKIVGDAKNISIESAIAENKAAKAGILERLGLTEEEAALLLG